MSEDIAAGVGQEGSQTQTKWQLHQTYQVRGGVSQEVLKQSVSVRVSPILHPLCYNHNTSHSPP